MKCKILVSGAGTALFCLESELAFIFPGAGVGSRYHPELEPPKTVAVPHH